MYQYPYTGSSNSMSYMARYNDQKTSELLNSSRAASRDRSKSPTRSTSPSRSNSPNREDSSSHTVKYCSKTKSNFVASEKNPTHTHTHTYRPTPTSKCECNILSWYEYIGSNCFHFSRN